MSLSIDDVKKEVKADLKTAKEKLAAAEAADNDGRIQLYGGMVRDLEQRLTGLESLLPKPSKHTPSFFHTLCLFWCILYFFYIFLLQRRDHRILVKGDKMIRKQQAWKIAGIAYPLSLIASLNYMIVGRDPFFSAKTDFL
jgi:hypothetical protein